MGSFLACYDYGQGDIWFYVSGKDIDTVSKKYPSLLFFPSDPPWWTEEHERAARANDITQSPIRDILDGTRAE